MAKGNKSGNPDIKNYGKGTQFKKGYKPINPGRRKNLLTEYIHDVELSSGDVNKIIKNIIACNTVDDLKNMMKDTTKPFLIRYFCKLFVIEFDKGNFNAIEKLFNRAFGMPKQEQDINLKSNIGVGLTQEQKLEEVQKILEKAKKQNE